MIEVHIEDELLEEESRPCWLLILRSDMGIFSKLKVILIGFLVADIF